MMQIKKLYRLKYTNLNTSNREQPLSSTLLSQVDQYQIMVLTPQEVTKWPEVNIDPTKPNELKITERDKNPTYSRWCKL